MVLNVGQVLNSYRATMKNVEEGTPGVNKVGGDAFGDVLKGVLDSTVDSLKGAEKVSMAAVQGKANINEVITAVSSAEVALQTVITIRDKLVAAYQELMRSAV